MINLLRFICFVTLAFLSFNVNATHIAGGDVEYECTGPRTWKIRLTIYRLCTGAPLCSNMSCTQPMTARPNTTLNPAGCAATPNNVAMTLSLVKVEDMGKTNVALCGNVAKNGCNNLGQVTPGPYNPSIEKYVFEGTLNLSMSSLNNSNCAYWDVYWELCCRNDNIWNLAGSGGQSFRIGATINIFNRSQNPCKNNSPVFKEEPVVTLCQGQEYVFNTGALDPDGDSLTFEISPATQQGGGLVNYQPPGSATYPFPLNSTKPPHINLPQPNGPYVVIDSVNGDISLNALNNSTGFIYGNLNVRVKQWTYDTNGVPRLVGITQRDLQLYVTNCTGNNPPRFATIPSGPNNNPIFNYAVCAGEQLCFTVIAKDTDVYPAIPRYDTTFISWNQGIVRPGKLTFAPNYTVTPNQPRPREDAWQFCWQTEESDGRTLPYYFTVTGLDKFCPNIGRVTRSFSIRVLPTPKADGVKQDLFCGKWVYRVRKTEVKQTFASASMKVALNPYDYNFSGGFRPVPLRALNPGPNPTGPITDPRPIIIDTFTYTKGGKYLVQFTISTPGFSPGQFCTKVFTDTIFINQDSVVSADLTIVGDTVFCFGDSVVIRSQYKKTSYKYQWYRNNLPISLGKADSLIIKQSGTYKMLITDTVLNCSTFSRDVNVVSNPHPTANFQSTNSCIFTNKLHQFTDMSSISSGTTKRRWQFSINDIDTNRVVFRNFTSKGTLTVKLVSTSNYGCKDSITRNYIIDTMIVISSAPGSSLCTPDTTLFIANQHTNYLYTWQRNNIVVKTGPENYYPATTSGTYRLIYKNISTNCIDTTGNYPTTFYPKPIPVVTIPTTIFCISNNLNYNENSSITSGTFTRLWKFGDGTTSTVQSGIKSYTNANNYNVKLILTSNYGCKDSTQLNISVINKPNAQITSNGSLSFCQGKGIELSSQSYPSANYYWYRNNTLIINSNNNLLAVNQGGDYKLIVDNGLNCKDTSNSTTIQVYPKPTVGFTVNDIDQCLNNNAFSISDTSNTSSGGVSSRLWIWQNQTSNLKDINLSFNSPGVYTLKLKVTDSNQCSDSLNKNLIVSAYPNIGTLAGPTTSLSTQQTYDYNVNQQLNHSYNWTVTNGNIVNGQGTNAVKVQWLTPGNGSLHAVITNNVGCSDSTVINVNILAVGQAPTITSFTPQTGTNGTLITINGTNLNNASSVTFGGVNAKSYTVVSPLIITAIVDSGATGNVSVVTPNGTALLNGFTYTTNTGIAKFASQSYSIFPNPVSAEIIIESNKSLIESRFELMDVNGKVLINTTCNTPTNRLNMDVKSLSPAIYLLRITSQGQSNTVKIVKQ
jgi:hypothetical protein